MILDVVLLWNELEKRDLNRSIVVVADVLRATTVMVQALANGAKCIIPQASSVEADSLRTVLQQEGVPVLLCGEKEGFKRPGYDLGNSPLEFTPDVVKEKTIVHLTTNGTRALRAAADAQGIVIAAFSNLHAVAAHLKALEEEPDSILFVVSGKEGEYCIEDTVCLGGVLAAMIDPPGQGYELTDAARTAVDLYTLYGERLSDMVRQSNHGRYLDSIGLGPDLEACVQVNTSTLVPRMVANRVTV